MLLLSLLLGAAAPAASADRVWVYQLHLGNSDSNLSCAAAFAEPSDYSRATAWVLGYWSGLNVGAKKQTGVGIDTPGILGEVKLECEKHPSDDLVTAVWRTWDRLQREGK